MDDQGTTTVTTTAYLHTYSGSLTMTATNVSKGQVETALTNTFASQFNVSKSAVNVTATKSRRLVQAALRKLAGTWDVGYTVGGLTSTTEQTRVASAGSAASSDDTAFTALLVAEVVAASGITEADLGLTVTNFADPATPAPTSGQSGAQGMELSIGSLLLLFVAAGTPGMR